MFFLYRITHQENPGHVSSTNTGTFLQLLCSVFLLIALKLLQLAGLRVVGLLPLAHNPVRSHTIVQMWWIEKNLPSQRDVF